MAISKKHLEFVNNYFLLKMNQTDAYQATYPKASRESARRLGSQLLTNVDIQEEIKRRFDEQKMGPDEVVAELSAIARSDMSDFITVKEGVRGFYLDLEGADKKGLMKLVKKLRYNAKGQPEIELHDKLAALQTVGKANGALSSAGESEEKPFVVKVVRGISTDDI
jgi:hypothetical protein